ncbi:unnamed protein product [Gadus morhua 'NCC']
MSKFGSFLPPHHDPDTCRLLVQNGLQSGGEFSTGGVSTEPRLLSHRWSDRNLLALTSDPSERYLQSFQWVHVKAASPPQSSNPTPSGPGLRQGRGPCGRRLRQRARGGGATPSNQVHQTPPDMVVAIKSGATVTLNCSHSIENYNTILCCLRCIP